MATLPAATPDLRTLRLLVAVADGGGIGAAARALGISQPSASDGVRALERRLGLGLVRRGRTGSELTDAGRIVVELARRVLAATTDLTDAARTLRGEAATQLTVCASLTVAEHLVPSLREALANVARHAEASHVEVTLRCTADRVHLQVVDDGVGPPDHGVPGSSDGLTGRGLLNIAQRAESLGGTCALRAAAEGGAALEWDVPVVDLDEVLADDDPA